MAEPDLKQPAISAAVVPSRVAVTRRRVLQAGAATALFLQPSLVAAAEAIRPFRIDIPDQALVDLRSRLEHARWPERETVTDTSQGVPLKRMQELTDYWRVGYDWRRVEGRLNALPQFVTAIDGLDIQFAHIRSPHAGALPLVMTHGWPGSVIEHLVELFPDWPDEVFPLHAIYPSRKHRPAKVEAFSEFCRRLVGTGATSR